MDVRYINPFLTSLSNLFQTMLQVSFRLGKPFLKKDKDPLYEISAIIGISGNVTGSVVVSLSNTVAFQLASSLIGESVNEPNADCVDALGEIANMIVGGAKKDFPGPQNSISLPSVVIGRHKVAYPKNVPIISIPCDTNAGRMVIDIALKEVHRIPLEPACAAPASESASL